MKVSVLGAGAIGSMLGGLLQHDAPDLEVVLIVRGEHGRVIHQRGSVLLDGPWGSREVRIGSSFDPADIADSQFLLVTVKSQHTDDAMRAAASHLADAIVISIQNGINDHRLAPYVPGPRLVMGMTATNMAMVEAGKISLQLDGATVLGPLAGGIANPDSIDAALNLFGRIRCPTLSFLGHENAVGVRYNKLAVNALGYASCLSASNFITDALAHGPWREAVGLPIVRECLATFDAAGASLARIPGVPALGQLEGLMRWMDAAVVGKMITAAARRLFNRKPIVFSLLQDLKRRRSTEVEYINGEIVRLAATADVPVPFNAEVVRMVHELEQRGDGTFFSRDEVVRRFRNLSDELSISTD